MGPLLVGELQEDLLAFGVLEPLAVALEELVRSALALDADEQRLLIVDAASQLLGAFGEQAVRRALEEQERRPRLELRILRRASSRVARLERAEMLPLLGGEPLEDRRGRARRSSGPPRACRTRARCARWRSRCAARRGRRRARSSRRRSAASCAPVRHSSQVPNTWTTVCVGVEAARRGDLLESDSTSELRNSDERWQVLQTRWKCRGMPVGRLEARAALAEVDLAGDAGADHPLQRPVDRGAADPGIFVADEVAEIVRAQMAFLAQEDAENAIALAGALAAGRAQAGDSREGDRGSQSLSHPLIYRERLTAAAGGRGVRVLDREAAARDRVDEVDLGALAGTGC